MQHTKHEIIFQNVNSVIESGKFGQTFAVIHLYDKQHLVHLNDIIAIKQAIAADIGERIKLEKCLLVGNENFTLIGRPILNRDLVQVDATIIEKTMTQTNMDMFHIPRRHGFKRYRFNREPLTMLRINNINICHPLNTNQKQIN
ncbi:39S ribosomal protein L21, mitochondrial-like protein [Euroglyphus maynei]|uniref:Large ribosomal subunit protein bL21m n=1 Tax=Euroglyphus maynei TaxID=6958 RepID=A0A1Y3BFT0_EURMA|nr:39S ribosomal protein L21, mitochondrial-like protein [Euroglyphus maynei]